MPGRSNLLQPTAPEDAERFAPVTARPGHVQRSTAPGVPVVRFDKQADAAKLHVLVMLRNQPQIVEILERNAPPEHMYALHRAYGSRLVKDVLGAVTEAAHRARARVYLGEQLALHDKLASRSQDDLETIVRDLERLPDPRALALFEGDAVSVPWSAPVTADEPAPRWVPASTSLAAVKAALHDRLDADDYHRAIRALLAKADRALAARRAGMQRTPPAGLGVDPGDLIFAIGDLIIDPTQLHLSSPLVLSPVSSARVDATEQRIRAADSAASWMANAKAGSTASLALADLDRTERKALAMRLKHKPLANYLDGVSLQMDAEVEDDAIVIRKAIQGAHAAAFLQGQAIHSVELDVAIARAGELIREARARLAKIPPNAPEADRAKAQAEVTRLETMFYGPGSLVMDVVRLQAAQAAPESHEAVLEAQMQALGADPVEAGAERLRGASAHDPGTLIAALKRIPPPHRHAAMQRSGQADAAGTWVRTYSPEQRELLAAYLQDGMPVLGVSMLDPTGASAPIDPGMLASAMASPMVLPPELSGPGTLRPDLAIAMHEILDGLARQAANEVLARLARLAEADQQAVLADPRFAAKLASLPEGDQPQKDFKDALRDVQKHGPLHALTHYPGPGGSGDIYQKVILEALGARVDAVGQANLRRAYVAVERLGGPDQIKQNPARLDTLSPADRAAVAQLYGDGSTSGLTGEMARVDNEKDQQSAQDIVFGQPQLGDTAEATVDPDVESEYMYLRLETAAKLRDDGGFMDVFSSAGASVDEAVAELMVLYQQVRPGGVGRGELAQLADLYHRAMRRLDAYRAANESVASTAAQIVGAVVATVVVTIASGGTLGPVAVGAMAGIGGAAASAATGAAIRIDSTATSVLKDAGMGAVEGIAAVAGAGLAAKLVRAGTVGMSAGRAAATAGAHAAGRATAGIGTSIAEAAIDGAFGNAAGDLFQTAVDEATWDRGIAEAFAAMLAALARGAAMGAAFGVGIGGAVAGIGKLARLAARAGDKAAAGVGQLLDASGVGTEILTHASEAAEDKLVQVYRLIESGKLDHAEKILATIDELPSQSRRLLLDAARARVALHTVGDLGPVELEGVEIWPRVVEDAEFRKLAGGDRADALIKIEHGKPQIIARKGAPASAIREEVTHLHQWQTDLAMRRRMAGLREDRLAGWHTMTAEEKLGLHVDKLEIEADAQRRIIDQLAARAEHDAEAATRVLDAEETLFELGQRIDAVRAARGQPHLDLATLGLEDPPRLFAKGAQTPAKVEGLHAARARASIGKPIADAGVQRKLRRLGYRPHERTGTEQIFRIHRAPGSAERLPHLSIDEATGLVIEGKPGADFHERRLDAGREWRRSTEDLSRIEADLHAGALTGQAEGEARRALANAGPHVRAELHQRIAAGTLDDASAGLIARWGQVIEALESRSAGSAVRVTIRDLFATLPTGPLTRTQLDSFRRLIRRRTVDQLMSIEDSARRTEKLYEMIDLQPDNGSRGRLFTEYRRSLMRGTNDEFGDVFDIAGKRPRQPFTGPGLKMARTPDDEVVIRAKVKDQLPGGKYAIEDKTGDHAFDLAQAEDYARRADPSLARRQDGELDIGHATGGFKRTPDSAKSEYDGLIYVFSRQAEARKALEKMQADSKIIPPLFGRHPGGIHVMYLDADGTLKMLTKLPTRSS